MDARSSAASWPAISYGCREYGFQQAAPSRTRSVTRAISSRARIGGWNIRSLNTLSTSMSYDSAAWAS
nr:hypothetical protein [Fodinicola feengrottensis]